MYTKDLNCLKAYILTPVKRKLEYLAVQKVKRSFSKKCICVKGKEHSMLKLKMLNQTHFLSIAVYHKALLLAQLFRQILEHLLMTPLYSTPPIPYWALNYK